MGQGRPPENLSLIKQPRPDLPTRAVPQTRDDKNQKTTQMERSMQDSRNSLTTLPQILEMCSGNPLQSVTAACSLSHGSHDIRSTPVLYVIYKQQPRSGQQICSLDAWKRMRMLATSLRHCSISFSESRKACWIVTGWESIRRNGQHRDWIERFTAKSI